MPELDEWTYSDGKSLVCSSFVVGFLKAGGLFGDLEINATEFTPRDLYQLDFFDKNFNKPEKCNQQDIDKNLPYCQVMGMFSMDISKDGYSTITPYNRMFEKCPSVPPLYERTEGC